jgi:hypothetical protein
MSNTKDHGHDEPFVLSGPTHKQGYEPDVFPVQPIVNVPLLVLMTLVIAFVTIYFVWEALYDPTMPDPSVAKAHPEAAARNAEPDSARFVRITTWDLKDGITPEVKAPRLEYIRVLSDDARYTTGVEAKDDPRNSPEYYPDDLEAQNQKELAFHYADDNKKKVRLSYSAAMNRTLEALNKATTAKALEPEGETWLPAERPKESNGGTVGKAGTLR